MTWSFSRIHSFEVCPYYFYLHYIESRDGVGNFYADNGSLFHEIAEKLLTGEINLCDAPGYYIENYENICTEVKQSTMDKIFDKCLDYLCTVDDFNWDKYEIIGVEIECSFMIGKYKFTGFIDLLLREREFGRIILVDHKSADHFLKADGNVLKNSQISFEAYSHQMYLYCKYLIEKYGEPPNKIVWHHFKDGGKLTVIDFNREEYEKNLIWAEELIKRIYKEKRFLPHKEWFNCNQLCDYRYDCEYQDEE